MSTTFIIVWHNSKENQLIMYLEAMQSTSNYLFKALGPQDMLELARLKSHLQNDHVYISLNEIFMHIPRISFIMCDQLQMTWRIIHQNKINGFTLSCKSRKLGKEMKLRTFPSYYAHLDQTSTLFFIKKSPLLSYIMLVK